MTAAVAVAGAALALACLPVVSYLRNGILFRPPRRQLDATRRVAVSVLVPARNEEASIGPAVASILASEGVELELIVLDDHSTDRTAEIVREFASRDVRVRVESAPPLPAGWCGKQHACFTLAQLARFDMLTFLDADVRISPDAIARLVQFHHDTGADLVSGFPRQETVTLLEKLVLPLINWLVVCYLPVRAMRKYSVSALGAGCGQWFLTTRAAYEKVGGHGAVRMSLHDGVKLPRAYRAAGLRTDICDATDLAVCRMYTNAAAVWRGLAKNAREGLGGPVSVWVWTVLLFGGHVLPFLLVAELGSRVFGEGFDRNYSPGPATEAMIASNRLALMLAVAACGVSWGPRLVCAVRFRQSWLGAGLHPVGVAVLLAIQWYATVRAWLGRPVGWKGRAHPSLPAAAING